MTDMPSTCFLCGEKCEVKTLGNYHNIHGYKCKSCTEYHIVRQDTLKERSLDKRKLSALLRERHSKGEQTPFLHWGDWQDGINFGDAVPVNIDDLLKNWPRSVPEHIDRCFAAVVRNASGLRHAPFGRDFNCNGLDEELKYACLCETQDAASKMLGLLVERGWLTVNRVPNAKTFSIMANGWDRFEEITRGQSSRLNPVFVAMPFKVVYLEQIESSKWFDDVIKAACHAAGWPKVERADSTEHNESIMDLIVSKIEAAPFVVADMHDNNSGVYYEAGFARGKGVPVIYLVRDGEKPHFDITGLNHVRWQTGEELRKKLTNRILGSVGRGPNWDQVSDAARSW